MSENIIIYDKYIFRILEYFDQGYSSIFSNLVEVHEDNFEEYFRNKKLIKLILRNFFISIKIPIFFFKNKT